MVVTEMTLQVIGNTFPGLFPRRRTLCLILVNLLYFLLGMPLCTQAGGYIFLWLDWYTGVWLGPVVALIELIVVMWVYGGDRFSYDMSLMLGRPVPSPIRVALAFISPLIVTILFVVSIVKYVPPTYGAYVYPSWAQGLGWSAVVATMLPILIHIVRSAGRGDGNVIQNLKDHLRHLDTWGPGEPSFKDTYVTTPARRSTKDLFFYNLIGRQKKENRHFVAQEMSLLNKV